MDLCGHSFGSVKLSHFSIVGQQFFNFVFQKYGNIYIVWTTYCESGMRNCFVIDQQAWDSHQKHERLAVIFTEHVICNNYVIGQQKWFKCMYLTPLISDSCVWNELTERPVLISQTRAVLSHPYRTKKIHKQFKFDDFFVNMKLTMTISIIYSDWHNIKSVTEFEIHLLVTTVSYSTVNYSTVS